MDKQKQVTIGVIVLAILALVVVTVWQPAQLGFKDKTDYDALQKQAEADQEAYRNFLASLEPNYQASQQLLKKIATNEIVKKQIEDALDVKQRVTIPTVADSELKISGRTDQDFVVNYFNDVNSMAQNYSNSTQAGTQSLFNKDADSILLSRLEEETAGIARSLRSMTVPSVAKDMHKAEIVAFEAFASVVKDAKEYARGNNENPWPALYKNYVVASDQIEVVSKETDKLALQYDFENMLAKQDSVLIKTAQAQLGGVLVLKNLDEIVWRGIKDGFARSFANFSIDMLDKLIASIEKNFAIASQLYYSNDLGRFYSVEYMQKFVSDPQDQDIISKFLPQYFCVNPSAGELKQIFEAKAKLNQGNDIIINPSDPDYLQKLARLGSDPKNYPAWWESYYSGLAAQTQREAEAAATKEVISPGVKSGRDLVTGQVQKTISAITGTQQAALNNVFGLGTNNADNLIGGLVSGLIENLANKFVFTAIGGSQDGGSGGGIGIIQEQNVCLTTPQVKPVIPLVETQ